MFFEKNIRSIKKFDPFQKIVRILRDSDAFFVQNREATVRERRTAVYRRFFRVFERRFFIGRENDDRFRIRNLLRIPTTTNNGIALPPIRRPPRDAKFRKRVARRRPALGR